MTITELQKWVEDDWKNNSKLKPSVELQLLYIMEELGEVAEAIRKSKGAKDRKNIEVDLGSELADLIIAITTIANHFDVELDREVELFKARILERHKQGF